MVRVASIEFNRTYIRPSAILQTFTNLKVTHHTESIY